MEISRFNDRGIQEFSLLLESFKANKAIDIAQLERIAGDVSLIEGLGIEMDISTISDWKKKTVAQFLSSVLNLGNNRQLYYDRGLWTWLSAVFLDKLVPIKRGSSERQFREDALYVMDAKEKSRSRYHRHLLGYPSWVYAEIGERGAIFLRGPIYERGEVVEQLSAVQEIQLNPNLIEAASIMYYDAAADKIYRGAASDTGGTARRFRDVIQQFKRTFDLNSMDGNQIVSIMPQEFGRWATAA